MDSLISGGMFRLERVNHHAFNRKQSHRLLDILQSLPDQMYLYLQQKDDFDSLPVSSCGILAPLFGNGADIACRSDFGQEDSLYCHGQP